MCHKNFFTALDPYCASLCLEPHVNAYKTHSSLNFAAKVCPHLTLLSSSARRKANEVEFMCIFVKVFSVRRRNRFTVCPLVHLVWKF